MRILVVDDELLARQSIISTLNALGYNEIHEAKDGIEAYDLINIYKPEIVIADIRMPKLDGIELLSRLNSMNADDIIFVFLSGYDLFEHAQKAIALGAFSYLLKPVKKAELKDVLAKACKKLDLEKEHRQVNFQMKIKMNQGLTLLRKNFFLKLITEEGLSQNYIYKQLSDLDVNFPYNCFCIILVSIDNYISSVKNNTIRDSDLLKFSLENIASETLACSNIPAYPFNFGDGQGFLLNFQRDKNNPSISFIASSCEKVIKNINKYLNLPVSIGIGNIAEEIRDVHISYSAARRAIIQRITKTDKQVFVAADDSPYNGEIEFISLKTEQVFYKCFEKLDLSTAMNIINELYCPFTFKSSTDVEALTKMNFQLVLLIYKFLNHLSINPDELLGDEFLLYNELNLCTDINSILDWSQEKLKICFNAVESSYKKNNLKLIQKVKEYIQGNISKDITLEGAADYVHLSPSYLSKIFKQIEGDTFIGYVIGFRIKKARSLLKEGHYKVNDISGMVGFNDVKYFYKVFKKVTGFSPTDYKNI